MQPIVCGQSANSKKKRCETCQHFTLWGVSTGYCMKHVDDFSKNDNCKFHKREQQYWTKDGEPKSDSAYYRV